MPEKPKTLAEFKLPQMVLKCSQCGRKGRYNVARLIARLGPETTIRDFIAMIGRTCPRYEASTNYGRCSIGCDDLVYMFTAAPATDAFAKKQDEEFDRAKEQTVADKFERPGRGSFPMRSVYVFSTVVIVVVLAIFIFAGFAT